jgi:large subunit ribosomal protein L32e
MADEIRRLIRVRTRKGATFKRDGFGKKKQLSGSWRKPRGQHNKQREQKKAKGALPKPGFGSPIAVRGMHPSGFYEVLIYTLDDLESLNPKTHAVRIAANIGGRKRGSIQEKALSAGLKVLNAKELPSAKNVQPEPTKKAKEEKPHKEPAPKPKPKPEPKKKEEPAKKAKEEKKEPAKPEPKKKVKAEPSGEGKPKKTEKQKVHKAKEEKPHKEPAPKPKPKKSSKQKSESAKGTMAGQKTASKPTTKPKKKTGTGVKDNE